MEDFVGSMLAIGIPTGMELVIIGVVVLMFAAPLIVGLIFLDQWAKKQKQGSPSPPPVARNSDRLDHLERLNKLRQDGALTEEEFQKEKELLG